MAHTALHFSAGLALGMAVTLPAVVRALRRPADRRALAASCTRWVAVSWMLGTLACIPNFMRYAGLPEWFCGGWWMNAFLFHPLIDRLVHGGTLIGGAVLVAGLSGQYAGVLLALGVARLRGRQYHAAMPSGRR